VIAAETKLGSAIWSWNSIFLLVLLQAALKDLGSICKWLWDNGVAKDGRLAQLVRAPALQELLQLRPFQLQSKSHATHLE